jgi:hypothetical protein
MTSAAITCQTGPSKDRLAAALSEKRTRHTDHAPAGDKRLKTEHGSQRAPRAAPAVLLRTMIANPLRDDLRKRASTQYEQ